MGAKKVVITIEETEDDIGIGVCFGDGEEPDPENFTKAEMLGVNAMGFLLLFVHPELIDPDEAVAVANRISELYAKAGISSFSSPLAH